MDIDTLTQAQRAAHTAWVACPDKRRADKAALAEVLAAAARAVAAANRVAAPAPVDASVAIDAALARQAAQAADAAELAAVNRAARLYLQAHEWPRCGNGWPVTDAEMRAAALLAQHPDVLENLW